MAEKLPTEISDSESFKAMCGQVESLLDSNQSEASESNSLPPELVSVLQNLPGKTYLASDSINRQYHKMEDQGDADTSPSISAISQESNGPQEGPEGGSRSPRIGRLEGKKEVIEQFEPGVYATVVDLGNGNKVFKRVRFSKRRFGEHQAEEWWKENKERLLKKYTPAKTIYNNNTPTGSPAAASDAPTGVENDEGPSPS
ncbi:hypothetical protein LguiA_001370 [Lonicera macranthoides]